MTTKLNLDVRRADSDDEQYVYKLDVTYLEHYWLEEDWQRHAANEGFVFVGTANRVPVSVLVCDLQEFDGEKLVHIYKVIVDKRFRGNNLGKKLLAIAYELGLHYGCTQIAISVPHHMTVGENNCVGWLNKMGFQATKVLPPVLRAGEPEDVYLFTRKIECSQT
jgi:ribosomal protein S18 acetylase RimI-like enzyme